MSENFVERLQKAFGDANMAIIARRLDLPHATVRNYFGGRMPASEVLIKIANETNVSLNWLLIGTGEMYVKSFQNVDLGEIIERRIAEIVDAKLADRSVVNVQDLETIDASPTFDIKKSLNEYDDPERIMSEWFRFDGREYPQDYGVVFFQGWESFSTEEKLDAVNDAKNVLDRALRNSPNLPD